MRRYGFKMSGVTAALVAATVVLLWSAPSSAGTPSLGTDCGTAAVIVGSDTAGKVTLGSPVVGVPDTGTCTLGFSVPYTNPPACSATDETNGGGFPAPTGTRTTNTTIVLGFSTGSVPGDVVS